MTSSGHVDTVTRRTLILIETSPLDGLLEDFEINSVWNVFVKRRIRTAEERSGGKVHMMYERTFIQKYLYPSGSSYTEKILNDTR
jgi:hypothetical protein